MNKYTGFIKGSLYWPVTNSGSSFRLNSKGTTQSIFPIKHNSLLILPLNKQNHDILSCSSRLSDTSEPGFHPGLRGWERLITASIKDRLLYENVTILLPSSVRLHAEVNGLDALESIVRRGGRRSVRLCVETREWILKKQMSVYWFAGRWEMI